MSGLPANRYSRDFERVSIIESLDTLNVEYSVLRPHGDDCFREIVPISDLHPSALSFVDKASEAHLRHLLDAKGGIALVERQWGEAHGDQLAEGKVFVIFVDQPRLTVARLLNHINAEEEVSFRGIHSTAIVDPAAELHPTVSVGPYCVVGRCRIGENTRIAPFCIINHDAIIGERVVIREHCAVGGHSLGFARDEESHWVRIPHIGRSVIEDDVQLFPFAVVDRGTFGETRVRRGTKVGFYVLVGHNSDVGEDVMLTASVVLCGQSKIGARSWLGVGAIVKQGVSVGADVVVGLGGVVLTDVPDGAVVAGVPAKPLQGRE